MTTTTRCREYHGPRNDQGYGLRQGKAERRWGTKFVHRQVWIMANGPIPDGLCVLHGCDNPSCYRLDHLRLGTRAENSQDMVERGRKKGVGGRPRSATCPRGHAKTDRHGRWVCIECKREGDNLRYQRTKT